MSEVSSSRTPSAARRELDQQGVVGVAAQHLVAQLFGVMARRPRRRGGGAAGRLGDAVSRMRSVGVRVDDGGDVAALGDDAARVGVHQRALPPARGRRGTRRSSRRREAFAVDLRGSRISSVTSRPLTRTQRSSGSRLISMSAPRVARATASGVVAAHAGVEERDRHRAVHRAGVEVAEAEPPRDLADGRRLAGPAGSVDGDDEAF